MNEPPALDKLFVVETPETFAEDLLQPAEKIAPIHPTPNDPPWNSWIALALWFLSVIFIVITPALLLLPYLVGKGAFTWPSEELAKYASTDPTAIVIQMIAIIPAHLFTLIFAWLVVTKRGRFPFRETLGFRSGGVRWWHYILIFVCFFGLAIGW